MRFNRSDSSRRPVGALLVGALLGLTQAGCGGGSDSPAVGSDPAPPPGGTAPPPGLVVLPPGPVAADCKPGLISGFAGPVGDALTKVIDSGGGGGEGVGAGGDGADGAGAGGSLGQFIDVDVTAEFADGTRFGPVRTDPVKGMVTLVPCNLSPPVLVIFSGAPGSTARYFDEGSGLTVPFAGETLRSVLLRLDRNGGVTPFTDAMFSAATGQFPTTGLASVPGTVRIKAADSWKNPVAVEAAHEKVRAAVNDLLPNIYRIEDLRRLPVAVNADNNRAGSQALTDNQNGIYGAVVAGLAITAASSQANPGGDPALAAQKQLSADLADGVLDRRIGDQSLPVPVGGTAYAYDTFSRQLTTATGQVARRAGAGGLATRTTNIQQVRARSGVNPTASLDWLFSLQSDGRLAITGPTGAPVPPVDPALRFSRIDLLERSAFQRIEAGPTPPAGQNWQNCLVATRCRRQWAARLARRRRQCVRVRDIGRPLAVGCTGEPVGQWKPGRRQHAVRQPGRLRQRDPPYRGRGAL